jgi:hypothetical protein
MHNYLKTYQMRKSLLAPLVLSVAVNKKMEETEKKGGAEEHDD